MPICFNMDNFWPQDGCLHAMINGRHKRRGIKIREGHQETDSRIMLLLQDWMPKFSSRKDPWSSSRVNTQRKEWEYKGELSNQSFCISISMFVERPKVHQALQNCCTFWEVPWKSLGDCWWGEVFRWHSKWVNHLFHSFQSQVWTYFLQPLWTHYWQCMFLTQWRCLSIILLQLDQTKINCYSVGKSVFIFEV